MIGVRFRVLWSSMAGVQPVVFWRTLAWLH